MFGPWKDFFLWFFWFVLQIGRSPRFGENLINERTICREFWDKRFIWGALEIIFSGSHLVLRSQDWNTPFFCISHLAKFVSDGFRYEDRGNACNVSCLAEMFGFFLFFFLLFVFSNLSLFFLSPLRYKIRV